MQEKSRQRCRLLSHSRSSNAPARRGAGGLLRLLLAAAGAGADLRAVEGDAEGELLGVVVPRSRSARSGEAGRSCAAPALQLGLVVPAALLHLLLPLLVQQDAVDQVAGGVHAAIQIDGGEHGLRGVGQNGGTVAAAALFLSLLNCRQLPRSSACATSWRLSSQTRAARRRVRSPSGRSGCFAYRYSAVTKPSTASPRNSSRSLLRMPAARCSLA